MPAYSASTKTLGTLVAAADFSTVGQYRFGTVDSTGRIALASAGARVEGIITNNPAENRAVSLSISGIEQVTLGGTVSAGDQIASGANGLAVAHVSGDYMCGVAVSSGVSGDVISALLLQAGTES